MEMFKTTIMLYFLFSEVFDLQEEFENVVFLLEVAGCLQKEHDFVVADDCFE